MDDRKTALYRVTLMRGFTLLEIMVSIFIFGVVVTTVFGAYRMVFSSVEAVEKNAVDDGMAKNCLNRMILDLKSVYITQAPIYKIPDLDAPPDPYRIVGETVGEGAQSFGRIRFASLSHLPFQRELRDGIAEIVYYVQETDDSTYVLRRSDSLFPYKRFEPKQSDPVLCKYVRSLSFVYYDKDEEEYDHWDSDDEVFAYATPSAISIRLEFGDASASRYFETRVTLPMGRHKPS